jgi:hypothetical protein
MAEKTLRVRKSLPDIKKRKVIESLNGIFLINYSVTFFINLFWRLKKTQGIPRAIFWQFL